MAQAKASPVPALALMFRVSTVLRRVPSAVAGAADGRGLGRSVRQQSLGASLAAGCAVEVSLVFIGSIA